MTVEPLGSVMSIQAQGTATQKPAMRTEKASEPAPANVQPVEKVGPMTSAVDNAQGKGQANNTAEQGDRQQQTTNEQIRKAVERLNKNMESHSEAIFGIHEDTNRVTIKIVDRDTKEVIKELPPEKTLDMIAKVWELAGIMIDEKR